MRVLTLLGLVLAGCFSPAERDGVVACGAGSSCPPGMGCWDGLCYRSDPTTDAADAEVAATPDADAADDEPDAAPPAPDAPPPVACANGLDDDCDGATDWQDPGCRDDDDDDEHGDRKCDNGLDDDDDGLIDYVSLACGGGGDPHCWGPEDDHEND